MDSTASHIWDRVHEGLRAFIAKRVRNEADIEDLLQEVFVRVHRHVESLQQPDRMVSWVFQITRNAIIDFYRSAERRRELSVDPATDTQSNLEAMSSDAEELEAKYELSHCLRPMIDRLSPDYREAVTLVELQGLTHQEAATKLGLSVPGMKSRVQRGRQQLRHMLNECCLIELDRRGGVAEFQPRKPNSCSTL